jgi:hypothetical protein
VQQCPADREAGSLSCGPWGSEEQRPMEWCNSGGAAPA